MIKVIGENGKIKSINRKQFMGTCLKCKANRIFGCFKNLAIEELKHKGYCYCDTLFEQA